MTYPEVEMPTNDDPARETPPAPPDPAASPPGGAQAPAAPAPAAGAEGQAAAPGTDGQDEAPPALSDDQIISALQDPRAQTIIEYAVAQQAEGQQPQTQPAGSGSPAAPHTPAVPRVAGDTLGEVARMAEEGDLDGVRDTLATALVTRQQTAAVETASKRAADDARRQLLGEVAKSDDLANLTATEQLRLAAALKQGDASFVAEASKVIAERHGQAPPADGAGPANRAAAGAAVAASQVPAAGTPEVPGAAPSGAPPVPEGDDAKTKGGYEVLSEYFAWEESEASGAPPG